MARVDLLDGVVAPEHAESARAARDEFEGFLRRFALDETSDALTLYLTALLDRGATARGVRRTLERLDLAARLSGHDPWHQHPDVRGFLRGMFAEDGIGDRRGHYRPLYIEQVHALVDACSVLSPEQQRFVAAAALRDSLGLTVASLARLRWRDVRLTKRSVEIDVTTRVGRGPARTVTRVLDAQADEGDGCSVAAIRALRSVGGGEYVLGSAGRPIDVNRLSKALATRAGRSMPAQVRDPALLLIGYAAALRTQEALALRQRDVATHDQGLVLQVGGRRRLTFLPSMPDHNYDPASAWMSWLERLDQCGLRDPAGPAFHAVNFSVVFEKGLREQGLNRLVHQRAEQAGLAGRHAWTSLRSGMMRTAIRDDVPLHSIAAHVDLVSLGSVHRHEHRELLVGSNSVAARLGL